MIGKLKGILCEIDGNTGYIETKGGVFYKTYITSNILSRCKINDEITVYTYLQVRDDALVLFAFETKEEYDFFTLLLTVSGVGPKTAYIVIFINKVTELIEAIKNNDIDYFSHIKGLGKKTAMKIILELSQKLNQEFSMQKMYLSDDDKTVIDALVSLGFKFYDAKNAVSHLPKNMSIENKIKAVLKSSK